MVKTIKVFTPESGDLKQVSIDKTRPFHYDNRIPCKHDSPVLLDKQQALYHDENVPFFITRSKNDNTVVYRAHVVDGVLRDNEPLEVFWMGFSRTDAKETSESKLKSDLSWIEKKVAYGASAYKHNKSGEYEIHLVALPHMKPILRMHRHEASGKVYPLVSAVIGGRNCRLFRVYVLSSENFIGLPTVHWVNIHGIDLETGEEIVEKVTP